MMPRPKAKPDVPCGICGKHFNASQVRPVELVHGPLLDLIKQENPGAVLTGYICLEDLARYRLQLATCKRNSSWRDP
jgi:hypothetical protein